MTKAQRAKAGSRPRGLSALQRRFVAEYPIDLNATAAARRAGATGTDRTLHVTAAKWLTMPKVREAIAAQEAPRLAKAGMTAQSVLDAIARQVNADIRDLYDERGRLKPMRSLTRDQAAMIANAETIRKNAVAGDGHTDIVDKLKLVDRSRYVEMAARHFKLLTDIQVMVDGDWEKKAAWLAGARQRRGLSAGAARGQIESGDK